ncbi:urease accessory protein [Biostraticola tofi]|uniref:Urease accessory protein UreF n=2 Tax=Biostraticola tofi TaxID=466109 RepID=A0A4R3YH62_9GAMM|nr:urease accessory protein [Biostraticola tofi]
MMPDNLALLRLMQLTSANLPVGGFTYSQGLEWAVEAGWVADDLAFSRWQRLSLANTLTAVDWPLLIRLYKACEQQDSTAFAHWAELLLASRETGELRSEERQRGKALARLITEWDDLPLSGHWLTSLSSCQLAGIAWLGWHWRIPLPALAMGYGYNWLEGSVMAGLKLVPFGQQKAQQLLLTLSPLLPAAYRQALDLSDEAIGGSFVLQAIASACHETQYSRLFRS